MAVIKMDWQKNILIVAILAVSLLLVIRYKEFNDLHAPKITETVATSSSSVASTGSLVTPQSTAVADNKPVTSNSSKIIQVKTDSLNVSIDTLGGDIVEVTLPKHSVSLDQPDQPFVLLDQRNDHTYITQSGLFGINGTNGVDGSKPVFTVAQDKYELAENQNELIVDLVYQQGDVKITKQFTFKKGEYQIGLKYLIDNQSDNTWSAKFFARIIHDGKRFTKVSALEMNPFLGVATTNNEENYKKYHFEDIAKDGVVTFTHQNGWISLVQHYFISAWVPNPESTIQYSIRQDKSSLLYVLGFETPDMVVPAKQQQSVDAIFYAGPKDTDKLKTIAPHLNLTVDYGWLWWIAIPLFWLLQHIHLLVGNWGLAIIGLTFVVKLAFYRLSKSSYMSMAKMKKLQPKLADLKERYGEDRQRFSQEMMKLYKTEKVNPLGGCLPLLIQMPVFIALYWVLMESVELRHSPFFLWIEDLSRMDPYFVLPILYGISQFITMKFSPQPPDPMQARIMQMLPFVFTFMFLWFPSGLVLYWLTNNILQIIQQYIITKEIEKKDAKA
jgi:YidC/Oxa1 family membrane protein insertase